jgi:hypothetical protein
VVAEGLVERGWLFVGVAGVVDFLIEGHIGKMELIGSNSNGIAACFGSVKG